MKLGDVKIGSMYLSERDVYLYPTYDCITPWPTHVEQINENNEITMVATITPRVYSGILLMILDIKDETKEKGVVSFKVLSDEKVGWFQISSQESICSYFSDLSGEFIRLVRIQDLRIENEQLAKKHLLIERLKALNELC